jgi:hypothetical protein
MSQPSVSQSTEGSPSKRARLDKKQFIGPCYIRMQPLSFAIPLNKIRCDFINPSDETSVSRGARAVMDQLHSKVADKGLMMQSRKNTSWGKMGGAAPSLFFHSFLWDRFGSVVRVFFNVATARSSFIFLHILVICVWNPIRFFLQ